MDEKVYTMPSLRRSFSMISLSPKSNETKKAIAHHEFNVTDTEIYYFMVISCEYDVDTEAVFVEGSCAWKNPYGYLPGDVYMKFPVRFSFCKTSTSLRNCTTNITNWSLTFVRCLVHFL